VVPTPCDEAARGYVRELLSALAFLHERSIAHRDIKQNNLMLGFDGRRVVGVLVYG
jgi:serine/threonine protein kinase